MKNTNTKIEAKFDEASDTQLPFVELLVNLGYQYISRSEVIKERNGGTDKFILQDVAFASLSRINDYEIDGEKIKFSPKDIKEAIDSLESIQYEGLIDTSKEIFNLLMPTTGGKSIKVFHKGKSTSKDFRFVDFENIKNNSFHVALEYEASGRGNIRPDIIVFVNGIPFAIIENKKKGVDISEALNQHIRNQGTDKCPRLFIYPQLLVASNGNELLYGTTGTPSKFFVSWQEKKENKIDEYVSDEEINKKVKKYLEKKIDEKIYQQILADLNTYNYNHTQQLDRTPTVQDHGVISLFEFERFLDLCKNYVLYDAGVKKISRYQQYFAIHKMLKRIEEKEETETGIRRRGGLVWHTQGSGKSLTMVMFVKALIESPHIKNPRIIIVTDRRDLDKQISETFKNCNLKKGVYRTATGADLLSQIKKKNLNVVTTLIHKFDAAAKKMKFVDNDDNIFVLIDEAHRTQGGSANLEMNRIIPNACYIAFTGTPLMKAERASWKKFGSYIDKYTIDDALRDKIILPLIYEGRYVEMEQRGKQIDIKAERIISDVTNEDDKKRLEKNIDKDILRSNPGLIEEIAEDVAKHYIANFQGTGLKAQLVAPSKFAAITFQKYFEKLEKIETAIVISDESGIIDEEDTHKKEVDNYLKTVKEKYSSLSNYERDVIDSFKNQESGTEIIIVVDKLLTGFDAPRNTVLYLAKDLKDHNLLQAIARVNRLFDNDLKPKTAGFIIDYSENAQNLQYAMQLFSNFDEDDLKNALIDVNEKIKDLEADYSIVHDFFNGVKKDDSEALILKLQDNADREKYYENLNSFVRTFNECMTLQDFSKKFTDIDLYQKELKKFLELRNIASLRYADRTDLHQYKLSLIKILDKYIDASSVELLTEPIDITNTLQFQKAIDTLHTDSAKAEAIAAQTEKTIEEKYQEADPEFYKKFSHKIKKLIEDMHNGKLADAKAVEQLKLLQDKALNKKDDSLPKEISSTPGADVLYRNLHGLAEKDLLRVVLGIRNIIGKEAIIDWQKNPEIQRIIKNKIDDFVYDVVRGEWAIELSHEDMKKIVDDSLDLARKNYELFSV
ncbi:MAG: hypothetical protein COU28_00570 [Candidatus Magasanikbacteria bacterium CG10_big_fil_rev_8_21_14_0_10_36_16]|uniref:Type I restriction enzyme endonuclease subunit n=1 Tax=Candidatus Magasanikbacteria bacterium CG10_big_fil_rev_8_21_14_0_10_36_16 TaxID=1974645 RepID=A0A2H0U1C6_9BACT|nr:MAG: hypothetical protein COU28_00570 [Candidatus Magasanikbacteria bacterium CG10_big_fil_rev_8_21_14_0_10_36_16]